LSVFHYVPLHTSPMGRLVQPEVPYLPITEDVAHRLLRLPLFFGLRNEEFYRITTALQNYFAA
ncbi:MAG: DegT/DnrJ/EryC1/StrS family aminotransferase, partial [Verrucomicrobiota bacterium]